MVENGELPYYNLYINGEWRVPHSEQYRIAIDPSTGEKLAHIAQADIEDTRMAIRAARTAFDESEWVALRPSQRSDLLHKIVSALEARQQELADAVHKVRQHPLAEL